jgi:hypothetical protein
MGNKKKAAPKTYQVRISLNALPNIDEITGYIALHPQRKPGYILKLKLYSFARICTEASLAASPVLCVRAANVTIN